jgi:hypothetical protein
MSCFNFVGNLWRPLESSWVIVFHPNDDNLFLSRFDFEDLRITFSLPGFFELEVHRTEITE